MKRKMNYFFLHLISGIFKFMGVIAVAHSAMPMNLLICFVKVS